MFSYPNSRLLGLERESGGDYRMSVFIDGETELREIGTSQKGLVRACSYDGNMVACRLNLVVFLTLQNLLTGVGGRIILIHI